MFTPAFELPMPLNLEDASGDWAADCDDDWAAAAMLVEQMFVTAMVKECTGVHECLGLDLPADVPSAVPTPIATATAAEGLVASGSLGVVVDDAGDNFPSAVPTPIATATAAEGLVASGSLGVEWDDASDCASDGLRTPSGKPTGKPCPQRAVEEATSAVMLAARVHADEQFDTNTVFAWDVDEDEYDGEMFTSPAKVTAVMHVPASPADKPANVMEDTQASTCFDEGRSSEGGEDVEDDDQQQECARLVRVWTHGEADNLEPPHFAQDAEPDHSEASGSSVVNVSDSFEMDSVAEDEDRMHEELLRIGRALTPCQRRELYPKQDTTTMLAPANTMLYRNPEAAPMVVEPPQPTEDDWLHSQTMCFAEGPMSVNDVVSMVENPAMPVVVPMAMDSDSDTEPKAQKATLKVPSGPMSPTQRPSRTKHRVMDAPTRSQSTSRMVSVPSAIDMDLIGSPSLFPKTPTRSSPKDALRRSNSLTRLDGAMPGVPAKLNPVRLKGAPAPMEQGPVPQGSLAWSMRSNRRSSGSSLRYGGGGYGGSMGF